jgi:hypothetical protein
MAIPTGSIKRCTIFGIDYEVVADAEPNKKPRSEKEFTATSGEPLINTTKMVPVFEALNLALTADQHDSLDQDADDNTEGALAVTNAAGKTWRNNGQIMVGDYNTKASTCEVTLIPNNSDWAIV